ncbi:MAG: 3-keto-5-aminohexanoate cleavage protein [Candidatus Jordarchaeaceae archaeon]
MAALTAWKEKCIITCALTGGATFPQQSKYIPITPDQISDEAKAARDAGAAIVHVHVRDPKSGLPTSDLKIWRETLEKIKQKADDLIICCTTGGSIGMTADQRIAVASEFSPEMCSCNTETMNYSMYPLAERFKDNEIMYRILLSTKDFIFKNTFADVERFLQVMYENNVKPEFECYGNNGLWNLIAMIRSGWVKLPAHIQFVLGVLGGTGNTPYELMHIYTEAQRIIGIQNFTWSVVGIGYPAQFHLGTVAAIMGGHVRVGLEDNLYIRYRELSQGNRPLVEKMRKIVEELGREIATPEEARKILGLKGIDKVNF